MTALPFRSRVLVLLAAVLGAATAAPALAHPQAPVQAPVVVGMVEQPCPAGSAGRSPEELAYAKAVVTDGPMDPAALRAMAAGTADRDKADAWRLKNDWADLCRYREANVADARAGGVKVVFLGNSITELWKAADPDFFKGGIVDRASAARPRARRCCASTRTWWRCTPRPCIS